MMVRPIIGATTLAMLLPALLQANASHKTATIPLSDAVASLPQGSKLPQNGSTPPIDTWTIKGSLRETAPNQAHWSLTSSYPVPPGKIVDVEIHQNGHKIWQTWSTQGGRLWQGQANNLPTGNWSLDVGIFQPNWASLDGWWNNVASVNSLNSLNATTTSLKTVANQAYNSWRKTYVIPAGPGMLRVVRPQNQNDTVSEGIGYGMLLALSNNDLSTFQGLWTYAEKYRDAYGLMNWEINGSAQVIGTGSATDADEDMAYALVLAHQKWPHHGFGVDAETLINAILAHDISPSNRVLPGDSWGPTQIMNPSYIFPAYYQVFAQFTGNDRWNTIAQQNSEWLAQNANSKTGLLPDWINANGTIPAISWDQYPQDWYYDAVRVPWRLWMAASTGNQSANQILTREGQWIQQSGNVSLTSGYTLGGQPLNNYQSGPFISAAAFMAQYAGPTFGQQALNRLEAWHSTTYYGASLRALALATLAGELRS